VAPETLPEIPPCVEAPAEALVPLAGSGENPWVDIVTSKGTLRFELLPGEAPLHVHNFLTQAAGDRYDGTLWHRVVPDFVIQGGDYRGDGNGGGTWRGADDSLRHEFGPRKYARGSLGMPRNEDPDSGGSQLFVTHRATPHLDGRYTIFGELRAGFEVLDAIEVGDRIVDVLRVK
jgi:cyclophilin family peptidyl-prolyl cis-trans isomerase